MRELIFNVYHAIMNLYIYKDDSYLVLAVIGN